MNLYILAPDQTTADAFIGAETVGTETEVSIPDVDTARSVDVTAGDRVVQLPGFETRADAADIANELRCRFTIASAEPTWIRL